MSRSRSRVGLRVGRLHGLMTAGLIDSFGLALGWTVFNLYAVTNQGLTAVGIYNAAMLGGIALSAPVAAFLSSKVAGGPLLQATAIAECVCRVGSFVLLLQGAPLPLVAGAVAVMNILAWTGYAGMRAEVAAVSNRAAAMTGYMVCIASIEAGGAAVAAVLPAGSSGTVTGSLLIGVIAWYGACLVPQFVIGMSSRVARSPARRGRLRISRRTGALAGGFTVMLLASGPTLLSVGLAAEFHGRSWVAASAIAFTAGSLAAPLLAGFEERLRVPAAVSWPWLGAGMIGGWIVAPWHPGGLMLAQVLAGLCMTTFEGTMDARAASGESDGRVTATLAWTASARAFGSAVAVALIPVVIAVSTLGAVSSMAAFVLAATGLVALVGVLGRGLFTSVRSRRSVQAEVAAAKPIAFTVVQPHESRPSGNDWLAPVVPLRAGRSNADPISPELVLVDPELARQLLEEPAEPVPLRRAQSGEPPARSAAHSV